jgi:hypothetical protein
MKQIIILATIFLSGCSVLNNNTYNSKPVINANSEIIDYRIGDDWYIGEWSIAPEIENDTLEVICYDSKELFEFKTDIDNIEFQITPNTTKSFYVKKNGENHAHTIIHGVPFQQKQLRFDDTKTDDINIVYQIEENQYLKSLKEKYPLNFIKDDMSDTDVILSVLDWTNKRWTHNGNNSPTKNDAITILKEAEEGKQFPCFAYAIVLKDQLTAIGYNSRIVYLKTEDAAERQSPPGHVATEVYLEDLKKWVFLDAQFNLMPTLGGIPLNAVELQDAISNDYAKLVFESLAPISSSKKNYVSFVYDYLYYFDTSLDNRYDEVVKNSVDSKVSLMLVPKGAENLMHIDFWDLDIDYCIYTNSLNDFYAKPE